MSHRNQALRRRARRPVGIQCSRAASLVSLLLPLAAAAMAAWGCSEVKLPGPDSGVPVSLAVFPTSASFALVNGKVQSKKFYACATFTDAAFRDATVTDRGSGSTSLCPAGTEDVSSQVSWSVEAKTLGRFEENEFRTEVKDGDKVKPATHGGEGTVTALYGPLSATATVSITYSNIFFQDNLPATVASEFGGTKVSAVTIVYPPHNVLVPPNLGQMDVHLIPPAGTDLFKLSFLSSRSAVVIYTSQKIFTLSMDQWNAIGVTSAGLNVGLTVEATKLGGGAGAKGVSSTITLRMADLPTKGGLYYWVVDKPVPGKQAVSGSIYRYDFDNPSTKSEAYYTQKDANDCVGCHVLSRGGEYLAFTYSGGGGDAAIFDVKSKYAIYDSRKGFKADLQTFSPDGLEIIAVSKGVLTRREAKTGKLLETLPTTKGRMATHPDWSLDGKMLAYVDVDPKDYYVTYIDDVHFKNGSIALMTRDGGKWSAPTIIAKCGGGINCYYPSFSPESTPDAGSDWIVYNRSTGDSYSDVDANIWIMRTDGKLNRQVNGLNGVNISNSWPRWSPAVQKYKNTTLFWLTFSSVRNYGLRLNNAAISNYTDKYPQIWMSAFDVTLAAKGSDPSTPPFWLPFQAITEHNHIAQWTTKVVGLK